MPIAFSRKKKFLSALGVCLASCGLTLALLLIVYALRGIWPFGADNVAYVDTAQFYIPGYYALWDALHGTSDYVNWFAGLAESHAAGVWDYLNFPELILMLFPRDHLLEGLSFFLAAYLAEISLISTAVLCIRFPRLPALWKILLSLAYTFSGYVLQYYSNFFWLWIVAIFPLIPLSLERLLRDGKPFFYTAVFAYFIFTSIYFTYMVTVYILLFSLAYCLFILPKALRGDRLFRLGISTAVAFGLPAYWWLSSSAAITGSSRFQSNMDSGLLTGMTTWNLTNTRHTILMFLGMAMAFALLIRALRRGHSLTGDARAKHIGGVRFFGLLLGMLAVPVLFTNIDTAWHFGQYNFFPMRYGFMLPATLLGAAALVLETELSLPERLPEPVSVRTGLRFAATLGCAAALLLLMPKLSAYFREYGACFLTVLGPQEYRGRYLPLLLGCAALLTALYLLLFRIRRRRMASVLIAAALLLQLGANAYGLIAPSDDHTHTREYDPSYIETSDALYEYFSDRDISPLSRAKNVDGSLSAGYPSLAGISALSSVNSGNSSLRLGVFRELGYTVNYFRILDTGGTVFSDMLLGVDTILSSEPLDDSLYTDTGDTVSGIHIGTANYSGIVGLLFPDGALDDYLELLTLPERLNGLYRAFTGSDRTLASAPEKSLSREDAGLYVYTLTCDLPADSLLYMSADGAILNITAGENSVTVPSYLNTQNTVYPAAFNSNLLYLGDFPSGEAVIRFTSAEELTADDLTVTALDKNLLASFRQDAFYDTDTVIDGSAEGNTLTITCSAESDGMRLFLPLTYSTRWRITVNGDSVEAERALGTLMSIPVQAGQNSIRIERGPSRFRVTTGMIVSVVSLVVFALCFVFRRKLLNFALPPAAAALTKLAFYAVCAAVAAFLYLLPTALLLLRGTVIRF